MKQTFSKMWKYFFWLILLSAAFSYAYHEYRPNYETVNYRIAYNNELYNLLDWIGKNTGNSDVILTQWTFAPFIYGMSDRNVIATTKVYPSEVDIVGERYSDLSKFFFSFNEEEALRIAKKYNATHIIVPVNFDFGSCSYTSACGTLVKREAFVYRLLNNSGFENIKLLYDSKEFKVYKILDYPEDDLPLARYVGSETKKYLSGKNNRKNKRVVGSIIPHDIYHSSQIIIENLVTAGSYKKIIILGPDHLSKASYPISASDSNWPGFYSTVNPDLQSIKKLGIPTDNGAHAMEWSISTIIPFVNYFNPNATIVPVLFREDVTYEEALDFGTKLSKMMDEKTLIIASIDFSHIIPGDQKINSNEDKKSLESLRNFKKEDIYERITEGKPALVALLRAMELHNAKRVTLLNISSQIYPKSGSTISVGYISLHYSP